MCEPILLSELSCRYRGEDALSRVSARLPGARVTALVGPNGSGKSTLLSVLAGVLRPYGGDVRGVPRNTAFVVQRSAVPDRLPITVRETVAMGRWHGRGLLRRLGSRDRQVVDACLERLGIADLAGRRLGELSGGQRQRALVAQGLAQQAELLLLDEPLAGVDAEAAERIAEAIGSERDGGVTIVVATHEREQARRADHVIHLVRGELVAQGSPAELLARR